MRILGDWFLKHGDDARAERYMRQVVTYKPESQMGWNALVSLYSKEKEQGAADPALPDKLAEALVSAGRAGEARRVVDEAKAEGRTPSADVVRRIQAAEAGRH
jgi:predicted Zn-dependent protease